MNSWLTTKQVAERIHRSVSTVHRAAERGLLHGHQTVRGGRWVFADAAVDAYACGLDERAQRAACCGHLRHLVTDDR